MRMNNLPRQKLLEIIKRYGPALVNEPRRCAGLMRDYFPAHRREIAVLTLALEERVPAELLAAGNSQTPLRALLQRLARRLHDNVAMEQQAALWTVHTWALALGVVAPGEIAALEQAPATRAEPQATRPAPPAPPQATQPAPRTPVAAPPTVRAPTSIIVAANGGGDFTTISGAINNAPAGARVLVRPGVYHEAIVLDRLLEIVGDGALETIVVRATAASCLLMQTDQAIVRNLTLRGEARGSAGFFAVDIPHGRLLLENCDITSDSLSCVAIHNSTAAPVLRRCRIHHGHDSGVYAFDGASGQLETCDIFENANIGVALSNGAQMSVVGCHIHHGRDAGLVIWNRATSTIEDCDIYANALPGLGVSDEGQATVRQCRIHEGHNTGVFVHRDGRATLIECNVYRHQEAEIATASGGEARLRECRIHQGNAHGVFVRDAGRVQLEACDVMNNRGSGLQVDAGGIGIARSCRLNNNGQVGVSCEAGGAVEVENCDLTGNRIAAWQTDHGAMVKSRGNRL